MLTLSQPWATLVALGVKTIETRSWQTPYRGPLAIGAAKTRPATYAMQVGDYRSAPLHDGRWSLVRYGDGPVATMPFGAIVAVCQLVDIAPIGGPHSFRTGTVEGGEGDYPGRPVVVRHPAYLGMTSEKLVVDHGTVTDVTAQLPYGDYSPGRYAWLLDDIRPLAEPVPCRGHQGLRDLPEVLRAMVDLDVSMTAARAAKAAR